MSESRTTRSRRASRPCRHSAVHSHATLMSCSTFQRVPKNVKLESLEPMPEYRRRDEPLETAPAPVTLPPNARCSPRRQGQRLEWGLLVSPRAPNRRARIRDRERCEEAHLVRRTLLEKDPLPPQSGDEGVVSGGRQPILSALQKLQRRRARKERSLHMGVLLTIGQVACELGVSGPWVHARIRAGELRALGGIGRGFRVRREWLDAFLGAREVSPRASLERAGVTARVPSPRPRGRAESFASAAHARAALVLVPRRRP